jgi:hypothetical protein
VSRQAPTGWSTTNYLRRLAAVWPGQLPFGVHHWAIVDAADADVFTRRNFTLGADETLNDQRRTSGFTQTTTRTFETESRTTSSAQALNSTVVGTGVWTPLASAYVSSTLRESWVNGTNYTSNTSTRAVAAPAHTAIGAWLGANPNSYGPNSALAEMSVWDLAGMTQENRTAWVAKLSTLVSGSAPNALDVNAEVGQPWSGKLVAYVDMDVNSPTFGQDLSGNGHHFTHMGALTAYASYPPVDTYGEGPTAVSNALNPRTRFSQFLHH